MKYIPLPLYFLSLIIVLMPITINSQSYSKSELKADFVEYLIKDGLPITNISKLIKIKNDESLNVFMKDNTVHSWKSGTLFSMMKLLFIYNSIGKIIITNN